MAWKDIVIIFLELQKKKNLKKNIEFRKINETIFLSLLSLFLVGIIPSLNLNFEVG